MDVSGKVDQDFIDGGVAGLAEDHPAGFPYRLREDHPGKFFARQGNEGGPEDIRKGVYRHEIVLSGLNPVSVVGGESPCRYQAVDVDTERIMRHVTDSTNKKAVPEHCFNSYRESGLVQP